MLHAIFLPHRDRKASVTNVDTKWYQCYALILIINHMFSLLVLGFVSNLGKPINVSKFDLFMCSILMYEILNLLGIYTPGFFNLLGIIHPWLAGQNIHQFTTWDKVSAVVRKIHYFLNLGPIFLQLGPQ